MATKVAINGFGRIGRNVARAIIERPDCGLELVSINDLADAKANALLFKRDSVHGPFSGSVEVDGNDLIVNGTVGVSLPAPFSSASLAICSMERAKTTLLRKSSLCCSMKVRVPIDP